MKRYSVILIFLLTINAYAQTATPTPTITPTLRPLTSGTCGIGLPCANVPWALPALPSLSSPTPIPTLFLTATPTATETATATSTGTITVMPTATATITPSPTAGFFDIDIAPVNDSMMTLQAIMAQTAIPIQNAQGTPIAITDQYAQLSSDSETFWGYVKSVSTDSFGSLSPLILLSITAFLVIIGTKIITMFVPLFVSVFNLVLKIIRTILEFLPG